jgi:hypothetical protein
MYEKLTAVAVQLSHYAVVIKKSNPSRRMLEIDGMSL